MVLHALEENEFVGFFRKWKKIKAESVGDRFYSRRCVGKPSQNFVARVEMGCAAVFVAPNVRGGDIFLPEKKIEKDSRARSRLTVHYHHVFSPEVRDGSDSPGIPLLHHDALLPEEHLTADNKGISLGTEHFFNIRSVVAAGFSVEQMTCRCVALSPREGGKASEAAH